MVKANVTLKDNVVIKSHAYIDGYTTIGEGTVGSTHRLASGRRRKILKFRGEKTLFESGKNCEIREFVTINSSCQENSVVRVGDNCLVVGAPAILLTTVLWAIGLSSAITRRWPDMLPVSKYLRFDHRLG